MLLLSITNGDLMQSHANMKTVKFAYQSGSEISVVFDVFNNHACYSFYKDEKWDWNKYDLRNMNKAECLELLAGLQSARIMTNPELFTAEGMHRHGVCIKSTLSSLDTWPDYEALYKAEKAKFEAFRDEHYSSEHSFRQQVYALGDEVAALNLALSKARAKIVALKRK